MTRTKRDLWLRLRQYHFADIVPTHLWHHVSAAFGSVDASTKAFASKIARKHQWSTPFALRAITEYRKFVFLGVTSDFVVTPSKVIDTVWHEHLLFTRPYREFCRDVLRQDFDHHPELLPTDTQTERYVRQFDATLAQYEREFHMPPPTDIWGTPKFKRDETAMSSEGFVLAGEQSEPPLFQQFDGHGDTPGYHDMPEFSVDASGGGFAGGGGGSDWSSGHGTDGHGDSGSAGDSGGDGGSGCSSACGGD